MKVDEIDTTTINGKRQRGTLLVLLKDKAGLTYKEISGVDIFGDLDLKIGSLGRIYKNMKSRSKRTVRKVLSSTIISNA